MKQKFLMAILALGGLAAIALTAAKVSAAKAEEPAAAAKATVTTFDPFTLTASKSDATVVSVMSNKPVEPPGQAKPPKSDKKPK
jgi:flagellar basal body-associated protein FliL